MACMGAACSVRLLGLHHSLYEHPVKVEITAPSDRSDPPDSPARVSVLGTGSLNARVSMIGNG